MILLYAFYVCKVHLGRGACNISEVKVMVMIILLYVVVNAGLCKRVGCHL